MTQASHWTASDGTRLHYRYHDFTDPWKEAALVVLLHPGLGSFLRLFGWGAASHAQVSRRASRHSRPRQVRTRSDGGLTHERLALDLVELIDHASRRVRNHETP